MNLGVSEIVSICLLLLYLFIIVDILRSKSKNTLEKIVWTCLILFLPLIGIIVYLSVGRKDKFLYTIAHKFKGVS